MYVHGGPFANVSIGIPTLVSVEMACAEHDIVIVEAGYGADAGAQKWLDIACRGGTSASPPSRNRLPIIGARNPSSLAVSRSAGT